MRAHLVLLVLLATVLASAGTPKPVKRVPGDAPAVVLADAVAQARAYAASNHIDVSKQYLQSAVFEPFKREWTVTWQLANARGGTTYFRIPEDGSITVGYGE
jgi:hypothetical protein